MLGRLLEWGGMRLREMATEPVDVGLVAGETLVLEATERVI
jgi:hypothetical protein